MKKITGLLSLLFVSAAFTLGTVYAGDPTGSGDVIGREGSSANPYGHVGMWKRTGNVFGKVVEVVPPGDCDGTNAVCSSKDLWNFKRASMNVSGQTRFWGARYSPNFTSYKVTSAGENQAQFGSVYSAMSDWREGGLRTKCLRYSGTRCVQSIVEKIPAQFRCDTFVWFSYLRGAGHNLLGSGNNPNSPWVNSRPSTIFNSLSNSRY